MAPDSSEAKWKPVPEAGTAAYKPGGSNSQPDQIW